MNVASSPSEAVSAADGGLNSAAERLRARRRSSGQNDDLRSMNNHQGFFNSTSNNNSAAAATTTQKQEDTTEHTEASTSPTIVKCVVVGESSLSTNNHHQHEENIENMMSTAALGSTPTVERIGSISNRKERFTSSSSNNNTNNSNRETTITTTDSKHARESFFNAVARKLSSEKRDVKAVTDKAPSRRSFFSAVNKVLTSEGGAAAEEEPQRRSSAKTTTTTATTTAKEDQPVAGLSRPTPRRVIIPRSSSTSSLPSCSNKMYGSSTRLQSLPEDPRKPAETIIVNNNPKSSNWGNVPRRKKKKRSPEKKYKMIKASWYHSLAEKNRLGAIGEDPVVFSDLDQERKRKSKVVMRSAGHLLSEQQQQAKRSLLKALNDTKGESSTSAFQAALQHLLLLYDPSHFNPRRRGVRHAGNILEGIGISAGKPTFPGCIGYNPQGDSMYKLGTMSFDMFCPTQLVLSVQGTFILIDNVDATNPDEVKHVPSSLLDEVRQGHTPVRTYNIVTPCTIEAYRPEFGDDSPNKGMEQPIRCVMTTFGFALPYPKGNRFAVWFTGGELAMDGCKNEKWFQIFDKDKAPKRSLLESGKVFAAQLLMGATTNDTVDENGKLSYAMKRPIHSHIDLIYLDPRMQIFRGSSGTVYTHVRIPGSHAVQSCNRSDEMIPNPGDPWESDSDDDDSSAGGEWDDDKFIRQQQQPPLRRHVVPQPVVPAASKLRRVVSESNLVNICPEGSSSPTSGSQSCLKHASANEAPKQAWYLDDDVS